MTLAFEFISGANLSLVSTSVPTQKCSTYLFEGEACRAVGAAGNL